MRVRLKGWRGADGVIGGDLVDQSTPWAGRDKVQHLMAGLLFARVLVRWTVLDELAGRRGVLAAVAAAAVLWEAFEGWRYSRYGYTALCSDEPDIGDVIATMLGVALALVLL